MQQQGCEYYEMTTGVAQPVPPSPGPLDSWDGPRSIRDPSIIYDPTLAAKLQDPVDKDT